MRRLCTYVQRAEGGRLFAFEQGAHESRDEYHGRLLCAIEDMVLGGQIEGAEWVEWDREGHRMGYAWGGRVKPSPDGSYPTHGLGTKWRHTGRQYTDRKVCVPGFFSRV